MDSKNTGPLVIVLVVIIWLLMITPIPESQATELPRPTQVPTQVFLAVHENSTKEDSASNGMPRDTSTSTMVNEIEKPRVSFTGEIEHPVIDPEAYLVLENIEKWIFSEDTQPYKGMTGYSHIPGKVEDLDIPFDTNFRHPCDTAWHLTYAFNWNPSMVKSSNVGYHPGIDYYCDPQGSNPILRASSNALVWKQWDFLDGNTQDAVDFWVSGRTYIFLTKFYWSDLPEAVQNQIPYQDVVIVIHIFGHLQFPKAGEHFPIAGDIVSKGDIVGHMGTTGVSTGIHNHDSTAIWLGDGKVTFVDTLLMYD